MKVCVDKTDIPNGVSYKALKYFPVDAVISHHETYNVFHYFVSVRNTVSVQKFIKVEVVIIIFEITNYLPLGFGNGIKEIEIFHCRNGGFVTALCNDEFAICLESFPFKL